MTRSSALTVRRLSRLQGIVVTPRSHSYGSLETMKLEELGDALGQLAAELDAACVIVDLTGVAVHGSAFLSQLIAFAQDLRRRGIDLVICGDQTGLLSTIRMDRWCEVDADLRSALYRASRLVATT